MTDIAAVLEQVQAGDISIKDAARRLGWLETGEALTCASCRFYQQGRCCQPSHPARPEHPDSVRCGAYEADDPRDHALPADKPLGSRMWK